MTGPEEVGGDVEVGERRGQADAGDAAADGEVEPVQQRLKLRAAFGADEGVQLVDDDVAQSREDGADPVALRGRTAPRGTPG